MSCDQYQELLDAFFDGERTGTSSRETFAHLFGCEECRTYWNGLLDIRETARFDEEAYPAEADRFVYGLRRSHKNVPGFEVRFRLPRFAAALVAALLLILAFGAGYIVNNRTPDGPDATQTAERGLPARIVYVYAIPGATVYANEEIRGGPKELKPIDH